MKSNILKNGIHALAKIFAPIIFVIGSTNIAYAANCSDLPSFSAVRHALIASVYPNVTSNGGFDLNMWATIVNRDGQVCVVTMSGDDRGDQWPGSRVISAQKANTANAFSLPGFAVSTANLFTAVQPGGSLFGLQHSNPVDTSVAYGAASNHVGGNAMRYGTANDPMKGHFIGGINVFGGGLALYNDSGKLVGGLGVSGDSSCADHNVAWRVREQLELHHVPAGVAAEVDDRIIYDITDGTSASGWGHPGCGGSAASVGGDIGSAL